MKRKRSAGRWVGKGWAYWTGTDWEMLGTEEWAVRWIGERIPEYNNE